MDITSIIENNTLLNIKHGITLEEVIQILETPFHLHKDKKNDIDIYKLDNVEFYFFSKIFKFGIVKIWSKGEFIYLDNKINNETSLEACRNILKLSNIPYFENEVTVNNHLDLELENGVIFSFSYIEDIYLLQKIEWGGKP